MKLFAFAHLLSGSLALALPESLLVSARLPTSDIHTNYPISENGPAVANGHTRATTTNYAGGGLILDPNSNPHLNFVVGTFVMPHAQDPANAGDGEYGGVAGVSIQGTGGAVQAGGLWSVNKKNKYYHVWMEWNPAGLQVLNDFEVAPGDTLDVLIGGGTTSGVSDANVVFSNHRTKKIASYKLTSPTPSKPLNGNSAYWVVEDYSANGGLFPFAQFDPITFNNCTVSGANTGSHYSSEGFPITMVQNGKTLATGDLAGLQTVHVHYG